MSSASPRPSDVEAFVEDRVMDVRDYFVVDVEEHVSRDDPAPAVILLLFGAQFILLPSAVQRDDGSVVLDVELHAFQDGAAVELPGAARVVTIPALKPD